MNIQALQKLTRESIVYTFDVKPLCVYELTFFIVSKDLEEVHNPSLLYVDFDGYELSDEERKLNALSISQKVGYFRYIQTNPDGEIFHKKFFIPKDIYQIHIGLMSFKNTSEQFISKDILFKQIPINGLNKQINAILNKSKDNTLPADIMDTYVDIYDKYQDLTDEFISKLESQYHIQLPQLYESLYMFLKDKSAKKAMNFAQKSLSLNPDNKKLRTNLAHFYMKYGFIQKAFYCVSYDMNLFVKVVTLPKLRKIARRLNKDAIYQNVIFLSKHFSFYKQLFSKYVFSVLKDIYPSLAITYGEKYILDEKEDYKFAKVFISRIFRANMYEKVVYCITSNSAYLNNTELYPWYISAKIKICIKELKDNQAQLKEQIVYLEKEFSDYKHLLYKELFLFFYNHSYEKAQYYIQKAIELNYDETLIKNLYDLHLRYGHIKRALSVLPQDYQLESIGIKKQTGNSLLSLLEYGSCINLKELQDYNPENHKIFYLLHNRLPYNSGGYATRTHGLLTNIAMYGWDIQGVSRLGYPDDKIPNANSRDKDIVDGISYHRLQNGNIGLGKLPMTEYLQAYADALYALAKKERPAIIHSASNHMNGLVGNAVAKALGIPSIYEVRGLWEITRISREPYWKDTDYYNLMVKLETQAAKEADVVLTLTEALKNEMIARGVDKNKIHIIPNGVNSSRFIPKPKDKVLADRLYLQDKKVIGYIGSVVAYEGLELLVDAIEILVAQNLKDFVVLIVGDGAVHQELVNRVSQKGLQKYFIFTGRVPHEDVEAYYSLVDITPFPRLAQPVCEMVSPLKPFEAMAMKKAVIASNVNALSEIVQDGYNGLLFEKGSVLDLANKIKLLIEDKKLCEKLGNFAREWVETQRDWYKIAKKVDYIYKTL